ncbi:hypothetical protein OG194_20565 [Streptomyces sp. NBC_01288]|uniref:hypothetical protein n=1 Tax=Streptomyces sp. NBC_01288 TaxID=2903814 RepID=UPI002E117747|nr:hypothetical protein OG194_20565 [Streptomyces sp. NBC_01288]
MAGAGVVFTDEPTGTLDRTTSQEVISLLVRVTKAQNTALVVVTHDESVARRCDRTIRVRDGRIVGDPGARAAVANGGGRRRGPSTTRRGR